MNIPTVKNVRAFFEGELRAKNFTTDKTGAKTIEWIGASFIADEPAIFGKPNNEYIMKEIEWYEKQSNNINDIFGEDRDPPAAWKYAANSDGLINSNYGLLIFSDQYGNQYEKVLNELLNNPDGRRAEMVYQRPTIWTEFNEDGKSDFICTNGVTYYIRNKKMYAVVQMRSNDVVFGYKNDFAWQKYVLRKLCDDINRQTETIDDVITPSTIYWQVQNLHVYERHFDLIRNDWDVE